MVTEDQSAVIAFLSSPAAHAGEAVRRVETHSAIVFLAGKRAWKLKRAVRYDYLDFSTADRRRAACDGGLRLNTRTDHLSGCHARGAACRRVTGDWWFWEPCRLVRRNESLR